jgi:heme/copper-type cytochrome/quinol oxidase subunit 3
LNPFPFLTSKRVLNLLLSFVGYFHFNFREKFCFFKVFLVIISLTLWWVSLIKNYKGGLYTSLYEKFFRNAFILFILSEVMFFFGFFWRFFHSCWVPTLYIGCCWPSVGFSNIVEDAYRLCKTIILLSSACSVTWAHNRLISENFNKAFIGLIITCILGFLFLFLQSKEYIASIVRINSTIFSTTFFLLTGFHGFHVTLGFIFLTICLFRMKNFSFRRTFHQGIEFAIWYWHFVDVVWLGLYVSVYHYGRLLT